MLLNCGKLTFLECPSGRILIQLDLNQELVGTAYDLAYLVKQVEGLLTVLKQKVQQEQEVHHADQ